MDGFPKKIYVSMEDSTDGDPYLTVAQDMFEGWDESREVAVYQLVEVGEVIVERRFVRDEEEGK